MADDDGSSPVAFSSESSSSESVAPDVEDLQARESRRCGRFDVACELLLEFGLLRLALRRHERRSKRKARPQLLSSRLAETKVAQVEEPQRRTLWKRTSESIDKGII